MKRMILSIVGWMAIGICLVEAQQQSDTTGMASESRSGQQNRELSEPPRQQQDNTRMNREQSWQEQSDKSRTDAYTNEGMVIIDKNEIPSELKQTLQKEKYAGWENATIYHNTITGEYVIAPRAYRFDDKGKEIEMPAAGRDGRRSRYSSGQSGDMGQRDRTSDNMSEGAESESRDRPIRSSPADPNSADQSSATKQSRDYKPKSGNEGRQSDPQQATNSYRTNDQTEIGAGTQTEPGRSGREKFTTDNMVEIQAEQIPSALRKTLRKSQYEGWEERGTLYQDPSNNGYVLVMDKAGSASERTYRFDKNGKATDAESESGYSRQDQ